MREPRQRKPGRSSLLKMGGWRTPRLPTRRQPPSTVTLHKEKQDSKETKTNAKAYVLHWIATGRRISKRIWQPCGAFSRTWEQPRKKVSATVSSLRERS